MSVPALSVSSSPAIESSADVLVVGALSSGSAAVLHAVSGFESLGDHFASIGVTGAADQLVRVPGSVGSAGSIAVIGIGRQADENSLRNAAGSAVRQLAGAGTVAFAFPTSSASDVEAILEGAALGGYTFSAYRSSTLDSVKPGVTAVTVHLADTVGDADSFAAAVSRSVIVAEEVARVKDLVNTPPSDLYPETLAAAAADAVAELPIEVTTWDDDALAADGFGGILGVGQGSDRGPRLVKLAYDPSGATKHLALVGKGITFDTGGLSLKPPASMVGMKYDMTGAASVLAVVAAVARLELPVRVTAWLCIAENMPSGSALRPNDVLRIRGGKTVEVTNTDAEGRLVMADGLVAASEEHPDVIIDIATLTGAAVVALGKRYTGVMGDDVVVDQVLDAARGAGEPMWAMPFAEELTSVLRSDVADLANAKLGNTAGGMLVAGVFLREFIGKQSDADGAPTIPWAHLDIAGPANNPDSPYGFTAGGPSGVGVRTLVKVAEQIGRP
ncbi:leucyl aminopeptidase [Mycetocola sp. CAN_C7]|uniref:leucyl aminopeptidase n=1 Tax=Mycetocola sp. CAN_C7 TaxID=2787724 RepID=UPI0018C99201